MASELIGRGDEIERIGGFLDASADEAPRALILAGEAGIGKSTLWLEGLVVARERGLRVLSTRPAEAERSFALAGLGDLFEAALDEVLPTLAPPRRRALQVALLLEETQDPLDPRALAVAVRSALELLAEAQPLLVAVDDVQWLDPSSSATLAFALRRTEAPMRLLLARRSGTTDSTSLDSVLPAQSVERLHVGPLSVGALQAVLRKRLDRVFPRPTLLRIHETSGGNPFYALELGHALVRRGGRIGAGEDLPLPSSLDGLVRERLDALTPAANAVVQIVAALAEPTPELVETIADGKGLSDALAASVLELDGERVRFTHPLLASSVTGRLGPADRRALHARLSEVTEGEEHARNLALATSRPDADVAATLDGAARLAAARGAPAVAAEFAEHAVRLTPADDNGARGRRRLELAEHALEAGDVARSIEILEHARLDAGDGPPQAAVLLRLANAHYLGGRFAEAAALSNDGLSHATRDSELTVELQILGSNIAPFVTDVETAMGLAHDAIRGAEATGLPRLELEAARCCAHVRFNAGVALSPGLLDRIETLEALLVDETPVDVVYLGHLNFWSGRLDPARTLLEEWLREAEARDDPQRPNALWYLALVDWREGHWERGAERAAEAASFQDQFGRGLELAAFPAAIIAAHRAQTEVARAMAESMLNSEFPSIAHAAGEWILGFLQLSIGAPRAALPRLERAAAIFARLGYREPNLQWYMPDLLEAFVAVGDVGSTEATVAPWEKKARELDRPWALAVAGRARGLVAAARGDLEGAMAELERALEEHERGVDPFQRARTLLALGGVRRRAKARRAARETLAEAVAEFDRLGAELWTSRAQAELGRIGGRTREEGLTAAERRVATLVAEGRTNREVAAALVLGERTVETHLTHIYAKLGVRTRTELARVYEPAS